MTRSAFIVLVFAVGLALFSQTARAAIIETTSRVSAVTVFSDLALMAREARVRVPAGSHTISVANLPASVNEATLRVQGKALVPVKIGTVDVKRIFLTEQNNEAVREKTVQIDEKTKEKALLQAEIKALQTKESFIYRIVNAGIEKQDPSGKPKPDFAPEKWQQAWNLILSGMTETGKEMANKNVVMAKIDNELAKLQSELAQIRTQQSKERREVHINVEASAETDLDLVLTYQSRGVSWRPVYDARLETGDGKILFEQYGLVSQVTGEDWDNVSVTLSTAQPAQGSEMPGLSEWVVRLFRPVQERRKGAGPDGASLSFSMMNEASERHMGADMAMGASMDVPAPVPVEAEEARAEAVTTEYSAEFKVPGKVALKSSRERTKLFIGTVGMKAELVAQTTPRIMPVAFLFAKATNGETYPLISGDVAKYRDGAFIGNAQMPFVRAGEEVEFSFGVDDRINVDYKRIKEKKDNPALVVVGDMTLERQYEAKVKNLHKTPISITVFDQYPVSADPDVKVSVLEDMTTKGYVQAKDKQQGSISWTATYAPKEERSLTLGFRVRYPKGRIIEGL